MPAKRTKAKSRRGRITEADANAFVAGDGLALMRALGLKPWQFSPSQTADTAKTAGEIMAKRASVEAELMEWEQYE